MSKILELAEERGKLWKATRELLDKAEEEKRNLNAEEQKRFDDAVEKVEDLGAEIERRKKAEKLQLEMDRSIDDPERPDPGEGIEGGGGESRTGRGTKEYRAAFEMHMRRGSNMPPDEMRALQADDSDEGGIFVPDMFIADLIKGLDNRVFIRGLATKHQVATAGSLGVPTLDTDIDDAEWTAELATGSEATAMRFGGRELTPHPLAKRVKISKTLIRKSVIPIERLVRERLEYKHGVAQENGFLLGNGARQPLGIYVASDDGISTSRDVSTGNTESSVTFDGLIEAQYTLLPGYWANARWNFHRLTLKQIAKLKDGEGQYIWRPAVAAGQPATILGFPYDISEYVPHTYTTGLYVGCFADFSYYHIADSLAMTVQVLLELYAEANQNGYIGRLECDGMPILEEAFVRVTLA